MVLGELLNIIPLLVVLTKFHVNSGSVLNKPLRRVAYLFSPPCCWNIVDNVSSNSLLSKKSLNSFKVFILRDSRMSLWYYYTALYNASKLINPSLLSKCLLSWFMVLTNGSEKTTLSEYYSIVLLIFCK